MLAEQGDGRNLPAMIHVQQQPGGGWAIRWPSGRRTSACSAAAVRAAVARFRRRGGRGRIRWQGQVDQRQQARQVLWLAALAASFRGARLRAVVDSAFPPGTSPPPADRHRGCMDTTRAARGRRTTAPVTRTLPGALFVILRSTIARIRAAVAALYFRVTGLTALRPSVASAPFNPVLPGVMRFIAKPAGKH